MSRRAVRSYLFGILDGNVPKAEVFEYHPKIHEYTDVVIVTRITGREKRASMPRGGGRKRIDSNALVVIGSEAEDVETVVARTDDMVQTVLDLLRRAPLPKAIRDPVSGEESTVLLVGEDTEYKDDRLEEVGEYPGAEGLVHSMITLSVPIVEIIVG